MPYEQRTDMTSGEASVPQAQLCGAPTKRGTPCKWPKNECPVEWHKNAKVLDESEMCGAPTRAGGKCRWPADECEYHPAWKAAKSGGYDDSEDSEEPATAIPAPKKSSPFG